MRLHFLPVFVLATMMSAACGQTASLTEDVKPPAPTERSPKTETEKLKGRRVMVIEEAAPIRTRENGIVWRGYLGEVLTVSLVNSEWLWIFERQGWLHSSNVIPFETAVYEMNARIKQSRRAENFGLRGIAHLAHGDPESAIKDFNEVIRRNPSDPSAFVNRGNAYRDMDELQKAVNDYSKAINLSTDHFTAMFNRALVQTSLKNYELALKDLDAAVILNQQYPEAHNARGDVYRTLKRYEAAEKEFTQAIKLYPRYTDAYVNRALLNVDLKNYEAARADFSQAIVLSPGDAEAMNDFAWFLATCSETKFRDSERAIDYAKKAVELTKERDWRALDTLGAAYAAAGNFPQAERYGEKAIKLAPKAERSQLEDHLSRYKQRKSLDLK